MVPELAEISAQQSYPPEMFFPIDQAMDSASAVSLGAFVDELSAPFNYILPQRKDPAFKIIGLGSSGVSDLGTRHDDYLVEELGKEINR